MVTLTAVSLFLFAYFVNVLFLKTFYKLNLHNVHHILRSSDNQAVHMLYFVRRFSFDVSGSLQNVVAVFLNTLIDFQDLQNKSYSFNN